MDNTESEIYNYEITRVLEDLKKARDFYDNPLGWLAGDARKLIFKLLKDNNDVKIAVSRKNRQLLLLKKEFKRIGGDNEFLARLWNNDELVKMK